MDKRQKKHSKAGAATGVRVFTLLLIICLVECATEQRINRGSKTSNLVEKIKGWRSQRGGSCLSYGHSCWGAHGKRSGKPPVAAPDWYLTRILRRISENAELRRVQHETTRPNDFSAIYQVGAGDNTAPVDRQSNSFSGRSKLPFSRDPEARPMLDDDVVSKMKIWQLMKSPEDE